VEIHSGCYHFQFDKEYWQKQNKPITRWPWEILPLPIDPRPFPEGFEDFTTGFYIPLFTEKGQQLLRDLEKFFTERFPKEALLQLRYI